MNFTKSYVIDVVNRIKYEFKLLWKDALWILYKVIYVAYIAQVPFRNIAYYRHEQRDTLKDIGYETIPEMNEEDKWISETVFHLIHIIGTIVLLTPWFSSFPHSNKIYGVILAEKWLDCLCIGHTFRFLTYVSTTLPGPASHCRPGAIEPTINRPTSLYDIFTRKAGGDDPNCGDLIFSGHVFQNIILSIIVTYSINQIYVNKVLHYFVPVSMWCLCVVQLPLIVAARNHYTVDITVSCYLAPLVWFFIENRKKKEIEIILDNEEVAL